MSVEMLPGIMEKRWFIFTGGAIQFRGLNLLATLDGSMMKQRLTRAYFLVAAFMMLGLTINSSAYAACQPYIVESSNGDGGFRFMHDVKNFRALASGTKFEALICDRKSFQIELAKKNPGTHVRFGIDGRFYEFGQGDQGDKNHKGWYRKYFDISY